MEEVPEDIESPQDNLNVIKYTELLNNILEGKEITHASVKKQIGRFVAYLISDYVGNSCYFRLEVPYEVFKSITANLNPSYPRTLPIEFLDFLRRTPFAAQLSRLLDDKSYMFYALVCYYFWQEIVARARALQLNPSENLMSPYIITSNNEVGFNPERYDTEGVPKMMAGLREAKGLEYIAKKMEGNNRGRIDLGGRSDKEAALTRFKQRIENSPELMEFMDIVIETARNKKVLASPFLISNLSEHKYPTYIPFPIFHALKHSGSKELRKLASEHYHLFSGICWKILNVLSNSESLFKFAEKPVKEIITDEDNNELEVEVIIPIEDKEFMEISNYLGWDFERDSYVDEQYIQAGIMHVFGIDLSVNKRDIDPKVYGDYEA